MRPIRASWPISASLVRISIAGIVSDLEMESNIRDWQETEDLLFFASFVTETELLKVLTPPSLEMERVFIKDDVSGAAWTTLAPVSRSWPFPAKVIPVNSIFAPRPFKMLIGYR